MGRHVKGGAEFLFWLVLFALICVLAAAQEFVFRRRDERRPWLKSFHKRNP